MTETVQLHWPRESTFNDAKADLRFNGPGVYEVPARLEAFYRSRGWEDPPEDFDGEAESPANAVDRNQTGPTREDLVDDAEAAGDDDEDGSVDSEAEAEESTDDATDGFDADAFVRDGNASDVADAIAAGDADGHLDAVRDAEEDYRDRTTVTDALDDRESE